VIESPVEYLPFFFFVVFPTGSANALLNPVRGHNITTPGFVKPFVRAFPPCLAQSSASLLAPEA
jgi:hypothetical protein